MSKIIEAKKMLQEFVLHSSDCSIYTTSKNAKVCFGSNKIVQIMMNENSISIKIYELENGKAKVQVNKKIHLKSSELFTVRHHFKKTHQEKTLKSA